MSRNRDSLLWKPRVDSLSFGVEASLLPAGQNYLGTLLNQRLGDRTAYAAARAGNQRDPPVKAESAGVRGPGLLAGGFWHG